MNNLDLMIERNLKVMYRLALKANRVENFDSYALREGKLSLLNEAIDEADIENVRSVIIQFSKTLDAVDKSLKNLEGELKGEDQAGAAAAAKPLYDYVAAMKKSLDEMLTGIADADFESGVIGSYVGTKLSLPQMVSVATNAVTRVSEFLQAYNKFRSKFVKSIVPMAKDVNRSALAQRSEMPRMPTPDKMAKLAEEFFKEAAGGGIFKKMKSFFGGLVTFGAASKALKSFPSLSAEQLGKAVTALFLNCRIGTLKGLKLPPIPDTSAIQDIAQEAADDPGTTGDKKEVEVEIKGKKVKFKKSKNSGKWYNLDVFEKDRKTLIIVKKETLQKIKDAGGDMTGNDLEKAEEGEETDPAGKFQGSQKKGDSDSGSEGGDEEPQDDEAGEKDSSGFYKEDLPFKEWKEKNNDGPFFVKLDDGEKYGFSTKQKGWYNEKEAKAGGKYKEAKESLYKDPTTLKKVREKGKEKLAESGGDSGGDSGGNSGKPKSDDDSGGGSSAGGDSGSDAGSGGTSPTGGGGSEPSPTSTGDSGGDSGGDQSDDNKSFQDLIGEITSGSKKPETVKVGEKYYRRGEKVAIFEVDKDGKPVGAQGESYDKIKKNLELVKKIAKEVKDKKFVTLPAAGSGTSPTDSGGSGKPKQEDLDTLKAVEKGTVVEVDGKFYKKIDKEKWVEVKDKEGKVTVLPNKGGKDWNAIQKDSDLVSKIAKKSKGDTNSGGNDSGSGKKDFSDLSGVEETGSDVTEGGNTYAFIPEDKFPNNFARFKRPTWYNKTLYEKTPKDERDDLKPSEFADKFFVKADDALNGKLTRAWDKKKKDSGQAQAENFSLRRKMPLLSEVFFGEKRNKMTIKEDLLTSKRVQKRESQVQVESGEIDRWLTLAGIK